MNLLRAIGNFLRFDRANWKAVLLCFFVAIVFWVFNAFNKGYATNVKFQLHVEYDTEKFSPVSQLPTHIILNVKGNGWDLFRSYMGIQLPALIIAVEKPLEVKRLLGESLRQQLEPQLGRLQINYVVTDTLKLNLDERDAHRFKVVVSFQNSSFKNGFGIISPVVVLPDSISLDGSKSLLHALPDSITLFPNVSQLSEDFSEEMEVPFFDLTNLTRNPPTVKVMFEVGQVIEVERNVKLVLQSSNKAHWPDSVLVRFVIPAKQKQHFDLEAYKFNATAVSKQTTKANLLLPIVNNLPLYAKVISVDTLRYKK
jgi:hypothetical protein